MSLAVRPRSLALSLVLACLTLAAGGCSSESPPAGGGRTDAPGAADARGGAEDAAPAGKGTAPELVTATWAETQKRIAAAKGKVVVVDFWSTWCTPCVREFPQLVSLQQRYPDDVVCLSVNCNFTGSEGETPEDSRDEIAEFLRRQKANFVHVLCADPDMALLEKLGAAAVPVVQVYDRSGTLQKQFTNDSGEYGEHGFEYEGQIEPLVRKLAGK